MARRRNRQAKRKAVKQIKKRIRSGNKVTQNTIQRITKKSDLSEKRIKKISDRVSNRLEGRRKPGGGPKRPGIREPNPNKPENNFRKRDFRNNLQDYLSDGNLGRGEANKLLKQGGRLGLDEDSITKRINRGIAKSESDVNIRRGAGKLLGIDATRQSRRAGKSPDSYVDSVVESDGIETETYDPYAEFEAMMEEERSARLQAEKDAQLRYQTDLSNMAQSNQTADFRFGSRRRRRGGTFGFRRRGGSGLQTPINSSLSIAARGGMMGQY